VSALSVVIPSYNRGHVLLDTIRFLQKQTDPANEIIIVDQTDYVINDPTLETLNSLDQQGIIRFCRRQEPSIPKAMNVGLLLAQSEYVLFLDDDINIKPEFIAQHKQLIHSQKAIAHVGQVLQPNELPSPRSIDYQAGEGLYQDIHFKFSSTQPARIKNCMAGNLCVDRLKAIEAGGFDENFIGVAYRFETEFCRRMSRHFGQAFYFSPLPVLYHLQSPTGGTRNSDHFLTSRSPRHSVGDYYYALLEGSRSSTFRYCIMRLLGSIKARFYLTKPWFIPLRLIAEVRGLLLACRLFRQGPKHCSKLTEGGT